MRFSCVLNTVIKPLTPLFVPFNVRKLLFFRVVVQEARYVRQVDRWQSAVQHWKMSIFAVRLVPLTSWKINNFIGVSDFGITSSILRFSLLGGWTVESIKGEVPGTAKGNHWLSKLLFWFITLHLFSWVKSLLIPLFIFRHVTSLRHLVINSFSTHHAACFVFLLIVGDPYTVKYIITISSFHHFGVAKPRFRHMSSRWIEPTLIFVFCLFAILFLFFRIPPDWLVHILTMFVTLKFPFLHLIFLYLLHLVTNVKISRQRTISCPFNLFSLWDES